MSLAKRQRAVYSDSNFQLLGAIVEAVTDQPLHEVVTRRILTPFSLDLTWFAGHHHAGNPTEAVATMWSGDAILHRPDALRSMAPDGGLIGTVDDALTFLRTFMTGKLFANAQTLADLQRRWNRFGFPRDRTSMAAPMCPMIRARRSAADVPGPSLRRVDYRRCGCHGTRSHCPPDAAERRRASRTVVRRDTSPSHGVLSVANGGGDHAPGVLVATFAVPGGHTNRRSRPRAFDRRVGGRHH